MSGVDSSVDGSNEPSETTSSVYVAAKDKRIITNEPIAESLHRVSSGVITITIKNGVLSRTTKLSGLDRMDPYVEIRPSWSRSSVYKTLPHENGHKRPEWHPMKHHTIFKMKFPGCQSNQHMIVNVRCVDKKRYSKHKIIGEGSFNIMPILRAQSSDPTRHCVKLFYDKAMTHTSPLESKVGGTSDAEEYKYEEKNRPQSTLVRSSTGNNIKRTLSGQNNLHQGNAAGRIWIDVHFQPEPLGFVQAGSGRGGLGALLGVVAEKIYDNQMDPALQLKKFVVMPNSPFRRRWDMVTMVGLLYTAIFTPVQIAFLGDVMTTRNVADWWPVFTIDRIIDVIFLLDIIVNFRSAWEADDGMARFDAKEGAWKYITGWFLLDLVSALPMDFLELLISPADELDKVAASSNLRSLKLIRLFRLVKIAKVVRASRLFKRFEAEMSIKYAMLRLIKFLVVILLVAHWNSCGFYLVSTLSEGTAYDSWAAKSGLEWGPDENPGEKYVASLYWAMMTLTTIGYGDIVATNVYERIYVIFSMMVCALVFAYVVGTMCSLVQGLNSQTLYFQSMIDDINDYMEMTHLPRTLRLRIRRYCLFRRDGALHQNERKIWEFLSPSLRLEAALHQYLPILEQVPYFRETSPHFVSSLACHLRPLVYGPNEVLFAQGTKERVMFILTSGRVHVEKLTRGSGVQIIASLSDGSFFGEQALLFGTYRNATVRSLSFCNTCVLRKEDVDDVLDRYPEDRKMLKRLLIAHMWKTTFKNPEFRQALIESTKRRAYLKEKMNKLSRQAPQTPIREGDPKFVSGGHEGRGGCQDQVGVATTSQVSELNTKLEAMQARQKELMLAVGEISKQLSLLGSSHADNK